MVVCRHAELDQLTRNISDLSHGGQSPNSLHSLVKSVQSVSIVQIERNTSIVMRCNILLGLLMILRYIELYAMYFRPLKF